MWEDKAESSHMNSRREVQKNANLPIPDFVLQPLKNQRKEFLRL